jgi:hypothetical protein
MNADSENTVKPCRHRNAISSAAGKACRRQRIGYPAHQGLQDLADAQGRDQRARHAHRLTEHHQDGR